MYKNLKQLFPGKKIVFVVGVLADKDYLKMFQGSLELANCYLTVTPDCSRALPGEQLADELEKAGALTTYCPSVEDAVTMCKENYANEIICAFGSLYFIGAVRTLLHKEET